MTLEQFVREYLEDSLMMPQDVDTVIQAIKDDERNQEFASRWTDDMEGYPPQFKAALIYIANQHALEWIDANCPKAFYRSMFTNAN